MNQNNNMVVSLFKGVMDKSPVERNLDEILNHYIGGGVLSAYTEELHQTLKIKGDAAYKKLKNTRETVCFSGVFKGGHRKANLKIYNPLIVLDIDKVGDALEKQREILKNDPYVFSVWRSPSGNGLKAIVLHNGKESDHELVFAQLEGYFQKKGIEIDPTGKDVSRMCHLSHDAEIVIKESYECFKVDRSTISGTQSSGSKTPVATELTAKPPLHPVTANNSAVLEDNLWFEKAVSFTANKGEFVEGKRNDFIHRLAANCNRWGKELEVTLSLIKDNFVATDFTEEEIEKTVRSVYNRYAHEFGSYEKEESEEKPKSAAQRYQVTENEINKRYDFRFNVITGRAESSPKGKNTYEPVTDRFVLSLERRLKHADIGCSSKMIFSIIESSFSKQFNPFSQYIGGLPKWDGNDHVGELAATVKTNDEGWEGYFRVWLRALVMCFYYPEIINHTMLILVGGQGVGKTTWLNNLVPKELSTYKFVGTINLANKDTLIHLAECVIINLDELENIHGKGIGMLKSVMTMQSIRMRKAYGRYNDYLPRRASFVGSINDDIFLTDTTGSRRFLPFKVESIDYQNSVDMDQVYAQVWTECQMGKEYYFTPEQNKLISERNEQFRRLSLEEDLLTKFFEHPTEEDKGAKLSTAEIIDHICTYSNYSSHNLHPNNVGRALKKLGYEQQRSSQKRYYLLRLLPVQGKLK